MGDLLGDEGDTLVISSLVGGCSCLLMGLERDEAELEANMAEVISCSLQSAMWLGRVCQ